MKGDVSLSSIHLRCWVLELLPSLAIHRLNLLRFTPYDLSVSPGSPSCSCLVALESPTASFGSVVVLNPCFASTAGVLCIGALGVGVPGVAAAVIDSPPTSPWGV